MRWPPPTSNCPEPWPARTAGPPLTGRCRRRSQCVPRPPHRISDRVLTLPSCLLGCPPCRTSSLHSQAGSSPACSLLTRASAATSQTSLPPACLLYEPVSGSAPVPDPSPQSPPRRGHLPSRPRRPVARCGHPLTWARYRRGHRPLPSPAAPPPDPSPSPLSEQEGRHLRVRPILLPSPPLHSPPLPSSRRRERPRPGGRRWHRAGLPSVVARCEGREGGN